MPGWWVWLLATMLAAVLALLRATWRVKVEGGIDKSSILYAFFHGNLIPLIALSVPRMPTLLVSLSRDGDLSAATSRRLGYGVVRGSSSRAGVSGAMNLARRLRGGESAALAVDGPRGPVGVAGDSAARLARIGRAKLMAVGAAARGFRLRSWDRMLVPWPFARVRLVVREVRPGESLQGALDAAGERARRWLHGQRGEAATGGGSP